MLDWIFVGKEWLLVVRCKQSLELGASTFVV